MVFNNEMTIRKRVWRIPQPIIQKDIVSDLPNEIQEILSRRGLIDVKEIEEYLQPRDLPDINVHFPQLKKAVDRIMISITNQEKIGIYGDYDADGITSTTLLLDVFRKLGANVEWTIPSRNDDGYGLNINLIKKAIMHKVKVIVTVDNGVTAHESLKYANKNSIDVIVTDHHHINKVSPDIFALIHPETSPDKSPYKTLAGVGLAYILALGVSRKYNDESCLDKARDLFCIGTVADMAQLKGANRYWLKKYLPNLINTSSKGLKIIFKNARIIDKEINSEDISFKIAPRINSVGRIGEPKLIIETLLEIDNEKAKCLAAECEKLNKERRKLSTKSYEEALELLQEKDYLPFILLAQNHWHHGIIGLIAAKIMERYNKPTAILAPDNNGEYRGSVRSPNTLNVSNALKSCSSHLEKYGGHSCAGGFTVKANNVCILEKKLIKYAEKNISDDNKEFIAPEVYLELKEINENFVNKLNLLKPFGIGNTKPLFWTRRCNIIDIKYIYGGHIILTVEQNGSSLKCIKWNRKELSVIPDTIDMAFHIESNQFSKDNYTAITLVDFKKYQETEYFKIGKNIYKCFISERDFIVITNKKDEKLKYNYKKNYIEPNTVNENKYINFLISSAMASLGLKKLAK